ncbi:DUF2877 domain-containing protein [Bacillus sp. 1NLA3E]|uniref:DUF2877 domain-containing protein n=1 Tax=Bacillus sp. 1NLA3E TaxID=666686 RepID=UPI000247EB63|nr:DUF2877 domain-containing protein [Bacillus sp. 1NLA3E]AGK52376.1 hypothetical protein B1NLA3E_02990 [Bacillus sp. 1NLA3E]
MIQAKSGDVGFIQAIEISKFNGIIHSIFDKTVNIQCLETGDLYSLACNKLDNGPNSIVIEINSFKEIDIEVNDRIFVENKVLSIKNKLAITIEYAEKWECSLPNYPVNDERLIVNLAIMKGHIEKHGKCGGMKKNLQAKSPFEVEMAKMLEERSHSLCCSLVNNRVNDALQHAISLIGLGPGLTPSGDDFLTGLLTTFNMPDCPCQSYKGFCEQVVMSAKLLTNDISFMTLRKASLGKVRESIVCLINSAVNGREKELISALDNVLKIGSSSGTDIALGLVSGLETNIKMKNMLY